MSLTYSGRSATNPNTLGTNYQATGSKAGEAVVVDVSRESLDDHGEDACLCKGSDKYDAGDYTGSTITVRNADFTYGC